MFSPFTNQTADNTTEKSFLKNNMLHYIDSTDIKYWEKKSLFKEKRKKKKSFLLLLGL